MEMVNHSTLKPKPMTPELLKQITNNFSDELGSGTFGKVYKGLLQNGENIAVKMLNLVPGQNDEEQFMGEAKNLLRVSHHNIVQLVGYCYEVKHEILKVEGDYIAAKQIYRALCFEYMHNGSLKRHIKDEYQGDGLDWQKRYKIIKGTCEGLKYLHEGLESPMYHLDLKPDNILLDNNMEPKIADFGLSKLVPDDQTHATQTFKGTLGYLPPEYIEKNLISNKLDIFSLGVVIIQLIAGKKVYSKKNDIPSKEFIDLVQENWKNILQETSGSSLRAHCHQVRRCIEIGLDCVKADRRERPTIGVIIRWLNELEHMVEKMEMCDPWCSPRKKKRNDPFNLEVGVNALALKSPGVKLSRRLPVPDELPSSSSGREPLNVVIVYAFDCSESSTASYTVDDVFWMVQEKLTHFVDSWLGYICFMLKDNQYTSDMKLVDSAETMATGYKEFEGCRMDCSKNMASGLAEAHKMIKKRGWQNGIILLLSDGLMHKGKFFDGVENFDSKNIPVHTFTLGGNEYNQGLLTIAKNSQGGKFYNFPVPERPYLSARFSKLLDSILCGTELEDDKPPSLGSGREPLDLVMVCAFDCTRYSPVADRVFRLVHKKLTCFNNSCMGYIYPYSSKKNGIIDSYTSQMNLVHSVETTKTFYKESGSRALACTKNMASGLADAHKMISNRGYQNGIILFFSDGLINKEGDFFDGTENFISNVPVHTFTLGGDAYNHVLQSIAAKSEGGKFSPFPVPKTPQQSARFSKLLDNLLGAP